MEERNEREEKARATARAFSCAAIGKGVIFLRGRSLRSDCRGR